MGKGLLFIVLGKDAGEDAESEEHCKTLSKDRQKHLAGSNTSPPIPRHHIPTNALKNKFLSNRDGKVFIPNISGLEKNKTKSFLTFFFFSSPEPSDCLRAAMKAPSSDGQGNPLLRRRNQTARPKHTPTQVLPAEFGSWAYYPPTNV